MASVRQLVCFGALAALSIASPLAKRQNLPAYALTYAPYSYLYSSEQWYPSDIKTHLQNTIPEVNFVAIGAEGSVTLNTLNNYNSSVYLSESTAGSDSLSWIYSDYGKPSSSGLSAAPATIIAVQKNSTWVDVFYFYFYSYNYGGTVLDINFDDHVGDWEHNMHGSGSAYYWDVMTFEGSQPITYIANGGHANYATSGTQDYTIALGLVTDHTNAGTPWDLKQNFRGFWYDTSSGTFTAAAGAGTGATEQTSEGVSWLSWQGYWGDEQYTGSNHGQYCIFGECKYTSGPSGPVTKNLGRSAMCEVESGCTIYNNINDLTSQSK